MVGGSDGNTTPRETAAGITTTLTSSPLVGIGIAALVGFVAIKAFGGRG